MSASADNGPQGGLGAPGVAPNEALDRLMAGHERYLRGEPRFNTLRREELAELVKGQQPYATILGCSDSRVPPEVIFDAGPGELFVIRVAGNLISTEVAGSIQYASMHLQTPLFVVLGHSGCGAVKAAMESFFHDVEHHSFIQILVDSILPAVEQVDGTLPPDAALAAAVEANVRIAVRTIAESPEGRARTRDGSRKVVGAIYDIASGRLRLLDQA